MILRIGFDLRPTQLSSQVMGIGTYIKNLIGTISHLDHKNKYVFLRVKDRPPPILRLPPKFKYEFVDIPSMFEDHLNVLRDKVALHKIVYDHNLDVVHFPSPFELKIHFDLKQYNPRSILTVHDLTPLFFGDLLFKGRYKLLKHLYSYLAGSIHRAGHIIAVSGNTRDDLLEKMNIPEEKISVIYEAAEKVYRPINDKDVLSDIRRKYNLPENFILYVGGFSPHKNLEALLHVIVLLKLEYHLDMALVVAGKKDEVYYPALKLQTENLGISNRVIFTDYVPSEDLAAFYSMASVFALPSLYEGFGLPLVEAMSCGAPCAASDTSSLPEIARDAAVFFNPKIVVEMAEIIHQVLASEEIEKKKKKKGLRRAMDFSWDKCARETMEIYQTCSGK